VGGMKSRRGPARAELGGAGRVGSAAICLANYLCRPGMHLRLALLIGLILVSAAASAQSLTGRVVDAVTQVTLPGANVAVLGPDGAVLGGAATDLDGAYRIDGL